MCYLLCHLQVIKPIELHTYLDIQFLQVLLNRNYYRPNCETGIKYTWYVFTFLASILIQYKIPCDQKIEFDEKLRKLISKYKYKPFIWYLIVGLPNTRTLMVSRNFYTLDHTEIDTLVSGYRIKRTPDDVALIHIHELGALACSRWTCQGTTEISHMYFNGASLKSLACN